jgi:hypothetical protein
VRGNVPSAVIGGQSRTFDDVWAIRNLNAPAGATIQFDNGEVISFAGVLTAWHAVLSPFHRVKVTAPAGPNSVLVDVAYDERTAERIQPVSQSLPLDGSGALQIAGLVSLDGAQDVVVDGLVSTSQTRGGAIIQSWDLGALLTAAGGTLEFNNHVFLKPDGGFTAKAGTWPANEAAMHDLSAYEMLEIGVFARGVTGAAPNFFISDVGAFAKTIRPLEGTKGETRRDLVTFALTVGAGAVFQRHTFGEGATEPINGGTQSWGFRPQLLELRLTGGGAGTWTGVTQGQVYLYGWK